MAVHSAKDLPAADDEGVVVAAVPPRADPSDLLVTRDPSLRAGAIVGTSSLRRRAQLLALRPELRIVEMRGNVDRRLRKLEDGEVDGVVLAAAGIARLGADAAVLGGPPHRPAPGQGCLAVQARADDDATRQAIASLDDPDSRAAFEAERSLMARLGGGCALPLGALATVTPDAVRLVALVATPDGTRIVRVEAEAATPGGAAEAAAAELLARGAGEILAARPAVTPAGGPLAGKVVLSPGRATSRRSLVRELERRGATAIVAPDHRGRPGPFGRADQRVAGPRGRGVRLDHADQPDHRRRPRVAAGTGDVRARVAAVGEGTAAAFRRWAGREPDLVPKTFTTAALAHAFPRGRGPGAVRPSGRRARRLRGSPCRQGMDARVRVDAYRTKMPEWLPIGAREALARGTVDAITFTSASSVRGFANAATDVRGDPKVVCIGPVTAREARAHGSGVAAVAEPHTIEGLIAALERALAGA